MIAAIIEISQYI